MVRSQRNAPGNTDEAEALYPSIIEADKNCQTTADVEDYADKAIEGLQNIRKEYNLSECS